MRFSSTQDNSIKVVHGGIKIICNLGKVEVKVLPGNYISSDHFRSLKLEHREDQLQHFTERTFILFISEW